MPPVGIVAYYSAINDSSVQLRDAPLPYPDIRESTRRILYNLLGFLRCKEKVEQTALAVLPKSYMDGFASDVEYALKEKPVNAADAKCSDPKDKQVIDAFIEGLQGGFTQFNADIEKAIRATNVF